MINRYIYPCLERRSNPGTHTMLTMKMLLRFTVALGYRVETLLDLAGASCMIYYMI
jgi:hypothetical protein